MKGSPKYLAKQLMRTVRAATLTDKNGRKVAAISRHEMKAKVRGNLEAQGIATTPANVAKYMPVYSIRTEAEYKKAWQRFFIFVRNEYGVRDPAKVKRRHVEEFLQRRINADVKLRTFKGYAAALGKMELALNNIRKYPLHYSETINRLRDHAKTELDGSTTSRGYRKPEDIIKELNIAEYKIAAELQLYGGARISEISELKPGRNLVGLKDGEWTIRLTNTKGGRVRDMRVPKELYDRVEGIVSKDGKFSFTRCNYSSALKGASVRAGENWTGTHGLRWNFVQDSFRNHQEKGGLSFEEALQAVALEIGHSRPEITLHYLR